MSVDQLLIDKAYPHAAFVLVCAVPGSSRKDTHRHNCCARPPTEHNEDAAFTPVFANSKWLTLTGRRSVLDFLTLEGTRQFEAWVTGASSPETTTLDFTFPSGPATLELTRTTLPITPAPPDGEDSTNAKSYVVVTTVPRFAATWATTTPMAFSVEDPFSSTRDGSSPAESSSAVLRLQPQRSPATATSWSTIEEVLTNMPKWTPGTALHFHRDADGNTFMTGLKDKARAYPVAQLLEEFDFSKTSLGPRSSWDKTFRNTGGSWAASNIC